MKLQEVIIQLQLMIQIRKDLFDRKDRLDDAISEDPLVKEHDTLRYEIMEGIRKLINDDSFYVFAFYVTNDEVLLDGWVKPTEESLIIVDEEVALKSKPLEFFADLLPAMHRMKHLQEQLAGETQTLRRREYAEVDKKLKGIQSRIDSWEMLYNDSFKKEICTYFHERGFININELYAVDYKVEIETTHVSITDTYTGISHSMMYDQRLLNMES
jgi:hypothetical protein